MLYDIYLASDDILMCTLDDKCSSEYDIPFDTLLLESMLDIVHWLRLHSFLPDTDEPEWVCEECGSSEVETLAWVNPNEDNSFVDFLVQMTEVTTGVIIVKSILVLRCLQIMIVTNHLQEINIYG